MMFLPDQNVGAVVLTNSDAGQLLLGPFRRKLLEVLFDGEIRQADARLAAAAKIAAHADRRRAAEVDRAAGRPTRDGRWRRTTTTRRLASIDVTIRRHDRRRGGSVTWFDFGEWKSRVASRKNPDGTISFVTITPGMQGLEFVVGERPGADAHVPRRSARVRVHRKVGRPTRDPWTFTSPRSNTCCPSAPPPSRRSAAWVAW